MVLAAREQSEYVLLNEGNGFTTLSFTERIANQNTLGRTTRQETDTRGLRRNTLRLADGQLNTILTNGVRGLIGNRITIVLS